MTWCLARDPASVTASRHLLDAALTLLGVTVHCRGEIAVLITEACTNAVRHADGECYQVTVDADGEQCVIEVTDFGPGQVVAPIDGPDPTAEMGRGLFIIRAYSDLLEIRPGSPR